MLGIGRSTCHSFPTRWSPYSFGCSNTCWDRHFPILNNTIGHQSPVIPSCLFSNPTVWELSGLVLSLVVGFFGELIIWVGVCFIFNRCSFKYHANKFSFLCGFRGMHLVINSSYHTCILIIPGPFLSTLCTCLGLPHPTIVNLSWCECGHTIHNLGTHLFWCPYKKWVYNIPWYILGYYCSYCFGKWSSCLEGGLPHFLLPHLTTSGYPLSLKTTFRLWKMLSLLT